MNTYPIGILDSGLGGLSIWQDIIKLLPRESTIYIGDHAYIPYGDKTKRCIQQEMRMLFHGAPKSFSARPLLYKA